jgi:hypothetical protein
MERRKNFSLLRGLVAVAGFAQVFLLLQHRVVFGFEVEPSGERSRQR